MKKFVWLAGVLLLAAGAQAEENCVECHQKSSPNIVSDWKASRHFANNVTCSSCHGSLHQSADDASKASLPTIETCAECHLDQASQFSKGKHAAAWRSMNAMPTTHALPSALTEGMKGCGGCHKLGLKSNAEIQQLRADGSVFGHASCDASQTRHTLARKEAQQPQACETCHMGFDHPQWEMYSASKHGVRYLLTQGGTLPESTSAPTCQTCHMPEGNHEVRTAWGFLAVRLPLPEDPQWKADQVTILQALGVLDLDGKPTGRLDVVKAADVARLTKESFEVERGKMLKVCANCHSSDFAKAQLARGDDMVREADHMLAEAIRVVAGLYQDGIIAKPASYASAFPDLLTFHDAPTVIEQKLFAMHLEHRMRAFQGTFHGCPDYALWYGWSEMVRDLQEIKETAEQMRLDKGKI